MLHHICRIKLRPNDDSYYQLSIKLPSADFREQWYRAAESKKGKVPMSLFGIVDTWVHQKHQNLGLNSPVLEQFFERRKGKNYPRLDQIGILSEQLINTSRSALAESAFFAWSLIESAQWFSLAQPNEESLTLFRDVLLADLKERGATNLLAKLEDGCFLSDDTEPDIEVPPEPKPLEPLVSTIVETVAICPEPDSVKQLNKFCQDNIRELDGLVEQAAAELRHATAVANGVLSSENAVKEIDEAIKSLENLRDNIGKAEGSSTRLEKYIADVVMGATQRLCIDLAPIKLPIFSIATVEQWKEEVEAHHEVVRDILRSANILTKFDEKLIQKITSDRQEKAVTLENAVQYLKAIENEAVALSRGIAARQVLLNFLDAKQEDFSWNLISDANIPPQSWIHAGEYFAAQGSMPRVLGICARKHYKQLHSSVTELIDRSAIHEDIPLEKTFDVLACLTLGQVEGINCTTEEGMTLLAIAELQSFLQIADDSSTEAYAFWSAKPLSAYVNEHSSTATERFFRAAYEASNRDGDSRLNITELRRLVMFPDSASLLKPKQVENSLRNHLLMAVEHHRGGGQTYAHLWESAYMEICRPLKDVAEKGALGDVADYYRQFRREFDIEDYLRRSILGRLRKQSQYEKNLRLAVNGKLNELDEWLHSYELTRRHAAPTASNDPVAKLRAAISDVLSARDPGCNVLRCWFKVLSKAPIRRPVVLMSLTRTLEPNFADVLQLGNDDAFHPRAFLAATNGSDATVADFLADELFLSFGLYTTEKLAKIYADKQYFEAFAALSALSSEEIPVDLERRVEATIDDLEARYLSRIETIEAQAAVLDQQSAELIAISVAETRRLMNNQQWTKADLELSDVERALNEFLKEVEAGRSAQALHAEIVALGGDVPIGASILTLEEARERIIAETQPRRQHLDCLKKLLAVEGLDSTVRDEFFATMSALERPENLPSATRSAEVAYVFSETVDILGDQIRRSKIFVPVYTQKLKTLALVVAKCLRLHGVNDDSPTVSLLLESAADWQGIPDGEIGIIERLLRRFLDTDFAAVLVLDPDIQPERAPAPIVLAPTDRVDAEHSQESHGFFVMYVDRLVGAISRIGTGIEGKLPALPFTVDQDKPDKRLSDAAIRAHDLFEKCDDPRSTVALGHLTGWAVSMLKEHDEMLSAEEHAAALHMINRFPGSAFVRALLPSKNSKGRLGEMVTRFLARVASDCGLAVSSNPIDLILSLSENIDRLKARQSLFVVAFSPVGANDSLLVRSLWESFTGGTRQAEARAALMNILWQTSATEALARCLSYAPIDLEQRKARAFALAASEALDQGRVAQLQSFIDLRKSVQAKPFQIFVDLMQKRAPIHVEHPASLELVAPLECIGQGNLYSAVISIKPRAVEKPDSITITLPQTAPLRFQTEPAMRCKLEGPFLEEETQLPINFRLLEANATKFDVTLDCEAESINGTSSKFTVTLTFTVGNAEPFARPTLVEIDEAFDNFPQQPVRGDDYVMREDDEKKIEKALFESKIVRSLWISSPRRSGKTTMLYRILDAYSHKAKSRRDNLVAYFTLTSSFSSSSDFNYWLWRTLNTTAQNKELRECFDNFSEIGRELPFDADSGTFLGELADRLKATSNIPVSRVIYLIDEVDRFASMYFEGGEKSPAIVVTWQIRELLSHRRDIGFVFAGSSAAKKIFLSRPEAPFYNTILAFELTPFSCKSSRQEDAARAVVMPLRMQGRFQLGKQTLGHLLWVCAGIPYYMKLLAGATMAVAKQPYLLVSDVNAGLRALLDKKIGISSLDDLSGDPGSDELRTIALENKQDMLLTKAVLYAVAEMHSPVSGHRLFQGKLFSAECPLVARYSMPKDKIEQGLELAIDLGILRRATDIHQDISFAIPILGEAIRLSCGSFWGTVEHQLDELIRESRAL